MAADRLPPDTPAGQPALARAELQRRLCAGEPCRAEDFLTSFPALASSDELAVELIWSESVIRERLGQHPDSEEWYARFPRWSESLRRRLRSDPGAQARTPLSGQATV